MTTTRESSSPPRGQLEERGGRVLRRTLAVALAAWSVACFSVPLPRPLTEQEARALSAAPRSPLRVLVEEVPHAPGAPRRGTLATTRVVEALRATNLFLEVGTAGQLTGSEDLVVTVHPSEGRPYYATPRHNPGLLMLSLIVPFWWSETYGYRLSVEEAASGRRNAVDTTREGTAVMWVLCPLLNLAPRRGVNESEELETAHLKLQLLPLVNLSGAPEGLPTRSPAVHEAIAGRYAGSDT